MSTSIHESSDLFFPSIPGTFDSRFPTTIAGGGLGAGWLSSGWAGGKPYSGVIASALRSVSINPKMAADPLLAIGYKGRAGYARKFGGADMSIDAVLTDNVNVSGAIGYTLYDFDQVLPTGCILVTTNGTQGRKYTTSGMYVSNLSFNFVQNAECTMAMNFVCDGAEPDNYLVSLSGAAGNKDQHCVNPLNWDEVHLFDGFNNITLTGVQRATFGASWQRQEIMQIGQFTPYDRAVIHPHKVNVTLDCLANDVKLLNWWDKFKTTYDPMGDCAAGIVVKLRTSPISSESSAYDFIIASGLRPASSTLNVAVGQLSTVNLQFEGDFLFW